MDSEGVGNKPDPPANTGSHACSDGSGGTLVPRAKRAKDWEERTLGCWMLERVTSASRKWAWQLGQKSTTATVHGRFREARCKAAAELTRV
jgi:hypothetical protein